jgi:transposase
LEEAGQSVLCLPPYHPDLNLTDNIWTLIKHYVAQKSLTFTLGNARRLIEEKMIAITQEEWVEEWVSHFRSVTEI